MGVLNRATFKQKEVDDIPSSAKILSKDTSITVEEIESGFLISKSTEVKYKDNNKTDYSYNTKKFFSKDNPLELKMDKFNNESFVENFK